MGCSDAVRKRRSFGSPDNHSSPGDFNSPWGHALPAETSHVIPDVFDGVFHESK